MQILSIDVGIKNLALCILEISQEKTMESDFNIIYWEIINLCDNENKRCSYLENNGNCSLMAKYTKNNRDYCTKHAKKSDYQLPSINLNRYKKLKIPELIKILEEYEIEYEKPILKGEIVKKIESFIEKKVLKTIDSVKCKEISLIEIGGNIRSNLDRLDLCKIDQVLIENQISTVAPRMSVIQGMLTQYFIMREIKKIVYISGINKLKLFIGKEKTTYGERKKLGIKVAKKILCQIKNKNKENWIELINKNKKADDLADSFLQAIWFLNSNKLIKLDLNII